MMPRYLAAYAAAGLFLIVVDLTWLRTVGGNIFRAEIGALLTDNPNVVAALLFYVLYTVGLMVFALTPAFRTGMVSTALLYGALFGFFCYITYDLTNLAVLKTWSVKVAVVDVAWGTFVTAASAAVGLYASRTFAP